MWWLWTLSPVGSRLVCSDVYSVLTVSVIVLAGKTMKSELISLLIYAIAELFYFVLFFC